MVAPSILKRETTTMKRHVDTIGLPLEETTNYNKEAPPSSRRENGGSISSPHHKLNVDFYDREAIHVKCDNDSPSSSSRDEVLSLEERVQELETKLATLSLLLQRERRRNHVGMSPHITPPPSPPPSETDATPALDSPAPESMMISSRRKRNLSFRVLYEDESLRGNDADDSTTIFLPHETLPSMSMEEEESSTIDKLLDKLHAPTLVTMEPVTHANETTADTTPTSEEVDESTNVKSKWLDYLNSVQESNYDTDKQMQEFVKVPGAVEALLSFGFWICVDSFLYVLTILPIRAVWSCLLLIRYALYRLWQPVVPEGPFRFHRRYVSNRMPPYATCNSSTHCSLIVFFPGTRTSSFKLALSTPSINMHFFRLALGNSIIGFVDKP